MKKTYYFLVIILFFVASCKKDSDFNNFYDKVGKGSYLTLVQPGNSLLNGVDPNSAVMLTVDKNGAEVESINIYVSIANTTDTTQWKLIKNVPFSGPTLLKVTNTEIANALGFTPGAIPPGNTYQLWNQVILKDGRKFSSFNTSAGDLESQPAFNVAMHWSATIICPYTPATTTGAYMIVRDDWEGRPVNQVVQVTTGPGVNDINLSQIWPDPANTGSLVSPLTITVDPATGSVSVPDAVTFGKYTAFGGYTAITVASGSSGFVFSCTGTIALTIHINAPPFGDQGTAQLIIKKM